ncbi:MAG: hypothetical protein OXE76_05520 [Alphaproteobacteria bacterium]|nr:hypothetical protein [Alphaproteobacteria bacterium]
MKQKRKHFWSLPCIGSGAPHELSERIVRTEERMKTIAGRIHDRN